MRTVPVVAVMVVLAVFAWHPAGLPPAFAQQDKLVHLLGFAGLALALRLGMPDLSRQEYAGVLLLAASALELGQTFLPARTGSLGDLAADGVGAVLGFALADAWRQWRPSVKGRSSPAEVLARGSDTTILAAQAACPGVASADCRRHDDEIDTAREGDGG